MIEIKILGPGCANCENLAKTVKKVVGDMGIDAQVTKVDDFAEIASFGMLSSPGLAINGKLVLSGRVPSGREIQTLIERALA